MPGNTIALNRKLFITTSLPLSYLIQTMQLLWTYYASNLLNYFMTPTLSPSGLKIKLTLQFRSWIFLKTTDVQSNTEEKKCFFSPFAEQLSSLTFVSLFLRHGYSLCFPRVRKVRIILYKCLQILRNVDDHFAIACNAPSID